MASLLPVSHTWRFTCATPAREVFAVFEQMVGTAPYRYEIAGADMARCVEFERLNVVGAWRRLARRDGDGHERADADGATVWKVRPRWVAVTASPGAGGTDVIVECSRGVPPPFGLLPAKGAPVKRALQVVTLLTRGARDRRTVYRDRRIPAGPVTLVASWAGMPYRVYVEPRLDAPRGAAVYTATRLVAVDQVGSFVTVRLPDGVLGSIEADQLVPAPGEATRAAQARTALDG